METREREQQSTAAPENGRTFDVPQGIDNETPARRRNLRPLFVALGVIAAIAIIIWGVRYFSYARVHETTDDARVDANTVAVTSKINERVRQILVDTDQPVKKGQLLVVLDDATERAAVDQALANLQLAQQNQSANVTQGSGGVAQAQGQVQNAAANVPVAQSGVAAAQAQVQQAQAALPGARQAMADALANLQRTQALVRSGDVPRAQLDSAKAQYAQAQSEYAAALQAVNVALANLGAAQQKVGAAQAAVAAARGGVQAAQGKLTQAQGPAQIATQRAALAIAEQNLANTRIYAATSGTVGEKSVEVGQTVSPGATLLTIIPNDVYVTANYKETQVGDMRPGQPADIRVDAYKGVTFQGSVDSINPASQNTYALVPAQNATGNFVKVTQRIPVKIVFDKKTDFKRYPMRPGMSVETSVKVR
ncbi:MAG TPA: HlyD family secretion protein [Candidatus Baltobacteraceae bacterium]|jgi:membrane fusion protein (multidrug efflux system)|nr:HlyD family secretion protein [Candidatus Baltobacteraceae bacterium]